MMREAGEAIFIFKQKLRLSSSSLTAAVEVLQLLVIFLVGY